LTYCLHLAELLASDSTGCSLSERAVLAALREHEVEPSLFVYSCDYQRKLKIGRLFAMIFPSAK